jgi:hypothetical protein
MASFCSLLSGITVTQVSGSEKHLTINVVGLTPSKQYTIETVPNILPVNVSVSPAAAIVENGLNTFSFTRAATAGANTIQLNIKLVSSGATMSTSYLTWNQFKGFSTCGLSSVKAGTADNTVMTGDFTNLFVQPITFRISNVINETIRVVNNGGTPVAIFASINSGSVIQTPPSVNSTLTFSTTITSSNPPRGENYLLMGSTMLNGVVSYILAEPFIFTNTFTYDQCTLIDRLFARTIVAGTVIIDGGSVV